MDVASGSDLRLGLLLLLNAALAVSAWRLARRLGRPGDWVGHGADALLLFYLGQYLAVCVPGLLGVLGPISMGAAAVVAAATCWAIAEWVGRCEPSAEPAAVNWVPAACCALVIGYVGALAVYYRHLPVMSQDAVTYHFPAAATWLRTGRLQLFETWFFNPANTYSPLAGSAFIAWLMAPLGNDTLASYVQVPALVGVWFVSARLAREAGLNSAWSALAATLVAVSQPFIRASVLSKDDLFVAMFFAAALAGLCPTLARGRFGPFRVGLALGLLLATKYTALLALPPLLLAADGPRKAGWSWRKWTIAFLCAAAIAGPWYVRNLIQYHNPLFPLAINPFFPGLFRSAVNPALRSASGIRHVLTAVDDALPAALLLVVIAGWATFAWQGRRQLAANPIARALVIGPPLGLALFILMAPYAEVRFLYPILLAGFVACVAGIAAVSRARRWGIAIVGVFLAAVATTGLPPTHAMLLLPVGLAAAAATVAATFALRRLNLDWTHATLAGVLALIVLAGTIYIYWTAYVRQSAEIAVHVWGERYDPDLAAAWGFVRDLPPAEPLAYANTYLVYPLMGFDPIRPVFYVPTRKGLAHLSDLPFLGRLSGDQMIRRVAEVTNTDPDEAEWLARIRSTGVKYLFVQKRLDVAPPPELALADKHLDRFRVLFDNAAARVYQVR